MSRLALAGVAIGLGVLAVAAVFSGATGADLARSALAAWLVVIALPLGALPVLMGLELMGHNGMPGCAMRRLLLAILPPAAVLGALGFATAVFIPGHDLAALYAWHDATHGFAAWWFSPTRFGIRAILYLAIWVALAIVFMRPAARPMRGRRQIAGWGLALHLVVGSLAAVDWTLSLDLGPDAAAFGLLLMTLQTAFALTVALLLTALRHDGADHRALGLMTLAAVAAAAFMQFTQYLVVWSANLPREIVWYQHRHGGLGAILFMVAPVIVLFAVAILLPVGLGARRRPVLGAAGLLVLLEIANLLWLVTPSWRGSFSVSLLDLVALIGFGAMLGAAALLVTRKSLEARHG